MKRLFLALAFVCQSALALTPSADGTKVLAPPTLTDGTATYSICNVNYFCRNGVATNGKAAAILWLSGKVYVKAPSPPQNWSIWLGNNKWQGTGSNVDPSLSARSPNLWMVPAPEGANNYIIDATGAKWTLGGSLGNALRPIMKDGQPFASGESTSLHYIDGNIYAFYDNRWWVAETASWREVPDPNPARNAAKGLSVDFTITPPAP